ncbi:uncharacterized protein LOC144601310 [Rhinoraja longicauda]
MKAETPVPRGLRPGSTPGLVNELLRPLVVRCPPLRYGGGLGNRLLEARPTLHGPSTASSLPLHFSQPLHFQLSSALTPPAHPYPHPGSGGSSPDAEKTEPPERRDDKTPLDPNESFAHLPIYNLSGQDYEDLAKARGDREPEEFPDVPEPSASQDARLRAKKEALLNTVCCSLLAGPKFTDENDDTRQRLLQLGREIAEEDPEFILKKYSDFVADVRLDSMRFLSSLPLLLAFGTAEVRLDSMLFLSSLPILLAFGTADFRLDSMLFLFSLPLILAFGTADVRLDSMRFLSSLPLLLAFGTGLPSTKALDSVTQDPSESTVEDGQTAALNCTYTGEATFIFWAKSVTEQERWPETQLMPVGVPVDQPIVQQDRAPPIIIS